MTDSLESLLKASASMMKAVKAGQGSVRFVSLQIEPSHNSRFYEGACRVGNRATFCCENCGSNEVFSTGSYNDSLTAYASGQWYKCDDCGAILATMESEGPWVEWVPEETE